MHIAESKVGWMSHPLLLLFLLYSFSLSGQLDSILALDEELQLKAARNMVDGWSKQDPATLSKLIKLEQEAAKKKANLLEQYFWLQQVVYHALQEDNVSYEVALQAVDAAKRKGWEAAEAECYFLAGAYFLDHGKYGPGYEYSIRAYSMFRELGFDKYPHFRLYSVGYGLKFCELGDYEASIDYFRDALAVPSPWVTGPERVSSYNTLAMNFEELEQIDSAIHYFSLAQKTAFINGDSLWGGISGGNLASIYLKQGREDRAIPLLKYDFYMCDRANETGSAVNAALALASIYLKRNNTDSATYYQTYADAHVKRKDVRSMRSYYENLGNLNRIRGNHALSLHYLDSARWYQDSLIKIMELRSLSQLRKKVEVERYGRKIATLEAKRSRDVLIRNMALLVITLLSIIAILILRWKQTKQKREAELAALREENAQFELTNARNELNRFARIITEKNALIESLEEAERNSQSEEQRRIVYSQLQQVTILTESDWREFRDLFEKVHPGFLARLKEKIPDLTPADTRLIVLTKLELQPKEMAAMLGISYDAIKKSRRRLRQRINLPEDGSLDELLNEV